jgi:hypothetical protein
VRAAEIFTDGAVPTIGQTPGTMQILRANHTATLLVASATTTACPYAGSTCILMAGGQTGITKTWEIFDSTTSTGNFTLFGGSGGATEMTVPTRSMHVDAQFSNGKVLLAGGTTNGTTSVTSTDIFDPAAATLGFTAGTPLLIGRMQHGGAYSTTSSELLNLVGGSLFGPAVEQLPSP